MTLLVFSTFGDWESTNVGFVGMINQEQITNKGYIQSIQEFIKDEDVLPGIYEDEHKGLTIRTIEDTESEFYDVMLENGLTLWADCGKEPNMYVEVLTPTGYWMYVIFIM